VKQNSRIVYVALLALVSLLLWLIFNSELITTRVKSENKARKPLPPELEGEPDVFMENATITQFSSNGTPKYQLYSQQLRHFEQEHLTRMVEPKMTLYAKQETSTDANNKMQGKPNPPWIIQSKHGYIRQRLISAAAAPKQTSEIAGSSQLTNHQEIVFLRENVKLSRAASSSTGMVLSTQTLYVYPHRQFAETDQPVTIDSRMGRTRAAGFTGDLKTGIFSLTSSKRQRVHTIVLPHQIKQKK